jgi:hypothetical protein
MTITLQAGYEVGGVTVLDGYYGQLSFDNTTQNLAGGMTNGLPLESLQWSPVAGLSPDPNRAR